MAKQLKITVATILAIICLTALSWAQDIRQRPLNWAQPMLGADLKNWHKVDEDLYRSRQPDADQFKMLERFGIKTVINLRSLHSDDDEARGTDIRLVRFKLEADDLTYDQCVAVLKAIAAAEKPALIHCWHGSDRTGAVVAFYRIAFHGWTPKAALDEFINGGFGYHTIFKNLPELILNVDPQQLRKDLGPADQDGSRKNGVK